MLRRELSREEAIHIVRREIDATDSQVYLNELRAHYPYLGELIERVDREYVYPMPYEERK